MPGNFAFAEELKEEGMKDRHQPNMMNLLPAVSGAGGALVLLTDWTGKTKMVRTTALTVRELKAMVEGVCGIAVEDQMLSSPSSSMKQVLMCEDAAFESGNIVEILVRPRCLGGKGGFGAMLRGQSSRPGMKQVAPNTGAMRDLGGRRLRHVEQDQKLSEWAAETEKRRAEKEAEKKEKRQKVGEAYHKVVEEYVAEARVDMEEVSKAVVLGLEEDKKKREKQLEEEKEKKLAEKAASKKLDQLFGDDEDSSSGDETADTARSSAASHGKSMVAEKPRAHAVQQLAAEAELPRAPHPSPVAQVAKAAHAPAAEKKEATAPVQSLEDINIEKVDSVEALEGMGGDRLKFALSARGMKCGGTPQQRAERLWSVKGLPKDKWPKGVMALPPK